MFEKKRREIPRISFIIFHIFCYRAATSKNGKEKYAKIRNMWINRRNQKWKRLRTCTNKSWHSLNQPVYFLLLISNICDASCQCPYTTHICWWDCVVVCIKNRYENTFSFMSLSAKNRLFCENKLIINSYYTRLFLIQFEAVGESADFGSVQCFCLTILRLMNQ